MIQWYLTGPRSKSAYAFTSADGLQCRCTRRVSKGSCTCEAPRVGGQSRDQNVEAERTVARYACSYRLDAADTSVTTHTPTDERWSRQCWRTPGGTLNTDIDLSIPCLSIPCLACSPQCRIRRSLIRNHDSTAMTRLVSCHATNTMLLRACICMFFSWPDLGLHKSASVRDLTAISRSLC